MEPTIQEQEQEEEEQQYTPNWDIDEYSSSSSSSSFDQPLLLHTRTKSNLHRSHTAPAIAILPSSSSSSSLPSPHSASPVVRHAFLFLLAYISIGVTVFCLAGPEGFHGHKTHFGVDAVYFCIVTLCTIGYGDIAPATWETKAFACLFVLVGFGLIDVLLSGAVSYMLDAQEAAILAGARGGVFVDAEKGRMRIRMKVGLAISVVILCVGGAVALYFG